MGCGLRRRTPTRGDGEVRVSKGRLVKLNGVRFEGRDAIQEKNDWLLTTRVTRYADSTGDPPPSWLTPPPTDGVDWTCSSEEATQ